MNLLSPVWNLAFFVGLIVYISVRGHFIGILKPIEKVVRRTGALDRALIAGVFLGAMALPLLYLLTPWLDFANYELPSGLPWCGSAVMLIALWLFYRAHVDLGLNWSVSLELRRDHELIERGVYARTRHPMYSAIALFSLAQALMLSNACAGPAALVSFLPMVLLRTPNEEQLMLEHFGERYRAYQQRSGRFVPRLFQRYEKSS